MMGNQKVMIFGSILLIGILGFGLYGIGSSVASGNFEGDDKYEYRYKGNQYSRNKVVENMLYIEECGSCHMTYPAQLLPAQSWSMIMAGLEDHFGENAELDEETWKSIQQYLDQQTKYEKSRYRKMLRNLGSQTPLRITELPYFIHEHDEIPSSFIRGNDKVASLGQCNACHRGAEKGWFDEDNVVIPGVGRWDD